MEVLNDTVLCLLPADSADIIRTLRSMKSAKLLEGYRGTPHVDLEVLADAAVRIGDAAAGLGLDLTALEVNPLYVRGVEVEALDALATWRVLRTERGAQWTISRVTLVLYEEIADHIALGDPQPA